MWLVATLWFWEDVLHKVSELICLVAFCVSEPDFRLYGFSFELFFQLVSTWVCVCAVEIQTLPLPHPTGGDGGVLQAELESMHFSWHR